VSPVGEQNHLTTTSRFDESVSARIDGRNIVRVSGVE
jgi:hypothetical protein